MYRIIFFLFSLISPVILSAQLVASFSTSGSNCEKDSIYFTNTSTGTYNLSYWEFGDGTDTWQDNPVHIYQTDGDYTVTLKIIDNSGNSNTTTSTITINPKPDVEIKQNTLVQSLTAVSSDPNATFQWVFNSDTTNQTDSTIYYMESGKYTVIATNTYSCSNSASKDIKLNNGNTSSEDSLSIVVKNNILTPDIQDGANDVLFIDNLSSYESPCSVSIYNSWGQLVYKNDNYSNIDGFKGEDNSGKKLNAGTYFYVIKTEGRKTATGYVDLIR